MEKKPIIVKGSVKRFRNYQFINDVVNILYKTLNNKALNKEETFNLTSSKSTKVSELLKIMLKENNLKKYEIL